MEILGKTADSQNGFRFKSNCIWLKLKWFWTELLEVEYFRTLQQSSSGDLTSGNSQLQHLPRNPPYLFVWLWPRFSLRVLCYEVHCKLQINKSFLGAKICLAPRTWWLTWIAVHRLILTTKEFFYLAITLPLMNVCKKIVKGSIDLIYGRNFQKFQNSTCEQVYLVNMKILVLQES